MITIGVTGIISLVVAFFVIKILGKKLDSNFSKEYEEIHGYKPYFARRYFDGPQVHHALGFLLFWFLMALGTSYEVWSVWDTRAEPWYWMLVGAAMLVILYKIIEHGWDLYQFHDEWSYLKPQ